MIENKQLLVLVTCVDCGSFSKAAELLDTTQSSVSKVIRSLELEVGFPLFIRMSHGMNLTPRGRRVYEYAKLSLEQLNRLTDYTLLSGEDELALICSPDPLLEKVFVDFYREHREEDLVFRYVTADVRSILKQVAEQEFEAGLCRIRREQLPALEEVLAEYGLVFETVCETEEVLCFGEENPMKDCVYLQGLAGEEIRLVRREGTDPEELKPAISAMEAAEVNVRVAVETNSESLREKLMRSTDLCTIRGAHPGEIRKRKDFRGIFLNGKNRPVIYGVIRDPNRTLSGWGEQYLAFLEGELR